MHRFFARKGSSSVTFSMGLCGIIAVGAGQPALAYYDCPPMYSTCASPDQGGTAQLPAVQCPWGNPLDLPLQISTGLPPGVTLDCQFRVHSFFDVFVTGAPPTGTQEQFHCALLLQMNGTGALSNFHRTITIPLQCMTQSGPRVPGEPVQSFDTEMLFLDGQITGDPDFDLLRITGGSSVGMPSPGHTTLTRLPSGHWAVDSFFDITYHIDFIGKPGSVLGGMSGSTTATIRMNNAAHNYGDVCVGPPVQTPIGPVPPMPSPCSMKGDGGQEMAMLNGLPPGSPIRCRAAIEGTNLLSVGPGGSLGGTTHGGTTNLILQMQGEGSLSSFTKTAFMVCSIETSLGQVSPTAPTQIVPIQLDLLDGAIAPGDRDFDLLRVTVGGPTLPPSPGHTTLTRLPGGSWAVDSFFDITYRIDFIGHNPGPLAGMSGSTTGTIRMSQGIDFPALHEEFCGLEHVALGTITMSNEPNPADTSSRRLTACCLGSSGQDGVEIQLMHKGGGGGGGGSGGSLVEAPAQGYRCEMDWSQPGMPPNAMIPLPAGAGVRVSSFFDIFYGDLDIDRGLHLNLQGVDGFQSSVGLSVFGFDPVPIQATAQLLLDGQPVTPPHPMPLSPQMVMAGFASSQADGVTIHVRLNEDPGVPEYRITLTNPFDAVCSFPGEPTVTADQVELRVSLNGLPPGTRYIGNARMQIKTLNLGVVHLHNEHIIHRDLAVRLRESPSRGPRKGVRVATGDVNGDGLADLVVNGLTDPSLTDEFAFIQADLDGDGTFDPISSLQCTNRFGIGGADPLGPNGSMRASFFDIDPFLILPWVELRRCADGSCVSTDMLADFSSLGSSTMRCRAYLGGALVADIGGIPVGQFATLESPLTETSFAVHSLLNGGLRCDWSWGQSRRGTLAGGGGGGVTMLDRITIEPEAPTVPIEMIAMSLTGSNVCEMAITSLQATPLPDCPADIAPAPLGDRRVNVTDLLAVIGAWGPCPQPCPPCAADVNRDCIVNVTDLLAVIGGWGNCQGFVPRLPAPTTPPTPPAPSATPSPPSEGTPPRQR